MSHLPSPPSTFQQKKKRILEQLSIPDVEYTDASPKGSIDAGIRDLIDEINRLDGFVTTSSCAGRISVFVEGKKTAGLVDGPEAEVLRDGDVPHSNEDQSRQFPGPPKGAGVGGKGGGGKWLFVSHDPVILDSAHRPDLLPLLGLEGYETPNLAYEQDGFPAPGASRLIHFKFEPMILHILTASLEHAQLLLRCGLQAGFRESGAINLISSSVEPATPIIAIRTVGLALESLIGVYDEGVSTCIVSQGYLRGLVEVANARFLDNNKRIERFRDSIRQANHHGVYKKLKKDGSEWEDAEARRERKKAEGLRRKTELLAHRTRSRNAGKGKEDRTVDYY